MTDAKAKRKLTVIFYADVAGYSRLTGRNELGTHRKVMESLDYVSDTIKEADGSVLRFAGDAILADFSSVVNAVETAVGIQEELARRNSYEPEDEKVRLRVGLNIGEVMEDRGEIYGDGVNLAARLEAAAEPGGICISAAVYDQTKGRVEVSFVDGGLQEFKNIEDPVSVFYWRPGAVKGNSTRGSRKSMRPSLAVLPFDNMSGDPEQEYFADGISEDVITALSKVRSFLVIARNSTFTYKGNAVDVKKVASDLGVRYVLEGSVRKVGSRVRITAQLIDASTGHHVWAERYDRDLSDIFELQDEMTKTIAGAIEPELNAVERERAANNPPESLGAWEMYQYGLWNMWTWTQEGLAKAANVFKQAIELDPSFAPAHAYLSYTLYLEVILGWANKPDAMLSEGLACAERAIQSDNRDAVSYFAAGRIHMMLGNHDESIGAIRTALELNPNFAHANHALGFVLTLAGEHEPAKRAAQSAIQLSPRDPALWAFTVCHALTFLLSGETEEALEWAKKTVQIGKPTGYWGPAMLAACHANLGHIDDATNYVAKALEAKPDLSLTFLHKTLPTKYEGGLSAYLEGLRAAGLPE
ncbi:adenylate/guanylate cyclase domain-containing protein [Pseudomonadota bacterium]